MKALVIYTSQTGFTKKYSEWLAEKLQADLMTLQEAKKQKTENFGKYDAIIYGGWAMAGSVVGSKWFLQKAAAWKNKKLAIFCVGASPEEAPDVEKVLDKAVPGELKNHVKAFYCQGGLNYDKMNGPSRMAMKALASVLKKKKDATEDDKLMAEMISKSYDISDKKYVEPIVEYIMRE